MPLCSVRVTLLEAPVSGNHPGVGEYRLISYGFVNLRPNSLHLCILLRYYFFYDPYKIIILNIYGGPSSGMVIAKVGLCMAHLVGALIRFKRGCTEEYRIRLSAESFFLLSEQLFFGLIVDKNQFFIFQIGYICYKRLIHKAQMFFGRGFNQNRIEGRRPI